MTARSSIVRLIASGSAVRGTTLVAFMLVIYVLAYRPSVQLDPYHDITSQLTNTIRASNDGHPFAAYSEGDPTRLVRIDRYASGYYDPGLPALISATSVVGRTVAGEQFRVGRETIYQVVFGMFGLAALVLICPALPLPVSVGAVVALAVTILLPVNGQSAFSWPRWWAAYSTFLVTMLVVGLLTARPSRWRLVYFGGLTILVGCARLLRDEAVVTTYAGLGGLVAIMLVVWVAARWLVRSPSGTADAGQLLRRSLVVGAVFCLGLAAAPSVLRGTIAVAWGVPFAETTPAVHGSGHSLYLSLGYAENPYDISWRDNVAMSHSHLIDPTVRVEDPHYQRVLQDEAIRIMLESPWLVRANVTQRAFDTATALGTSAAFRYISILATLATVVSLVTLLRRRSPRLLVLLGGLLATGAGASAPALLIHPGYLYGIQATVILLAFVVPPAVVATLRTGRGHGADDSVSRRITARSVLLIGIAALALAASAAGWYAFRTVQYANELAVLSGSSDPLRDLERRGHRYARYFNDLPVDTQEHLIGKMSSASAPNVAILVPQATVAGFRPLLVAYTSGQIHIIAWLGKEQPAAAVPVGDAYAFVGYCSACERVRDDLPNDPYALDDAHLRLDIVAIHNRSWTDGYRLLSLPVAERPAGDILLALQHIASNHITKFDLATDGVWRAHLK